MDPDENLREQREIAERITREPQMDTKHDALADAARLAELVAAMDEWLVNGGFLPADWTAR